jgi:hypothetical protein
VVGHAFGRNIAFIGLERIGGIMVYDLREPNKPKFQSYINNRNFDVDADAADAGDLSPEGLVFIPAAWSPNNKPLLVVGNEISGTTTIYRVRRGNVPNASDPALRQIELTDGDPSALIELGTK